MSSNCLSVDHPSLNSWDLSDEIRDISEAEVKAFYKNGWVVLRGLISPALAREIRRRAKAIMGEAADAITGGGGGDPQFEHYKAILRNYLGAWKVDPLLCAISHSEQLGKIASKLLHNAPVRFFNDEILVKVPAKDGGKPTPYHQDFPHAAFDRSAMVNIWIAIVDIPVERAPMRFVTGSHRAGPLGRTLMDEKDVLEQQPWILERYQLSDPLSLALGDATIHGDLTIHGGPSNESKEMRWAYLVNLVDAHVRYNGAAIYGDNPGNLVDNEEYPGQRFPVVYSGQCAE